MYGFDVGMHVGDNLAQIEKKERAEAQAKAKARAQAKAEAQAQVEATQTRDHTAQAVSQPRAQSQDKSQKQKPGQIAMPFNVFQSQMSKATPGNVRQATASQRPGIPNRTISFPTFPTSLQKPTVPSSGLSSLAASAYNSPLPSPGLPASGTRSPWFPFPKNDGGDSNNTVSRHWLFLNLELQLTILKSPK